MSDDRIPAVPAAPPEAWLPARRIAEAMRRPIERFLHIEAASGVVLLAAAALALLWANSPWAQSYEDFWHTPIAIGVGSWRFEASLHFWVNDLLMTVFFLVAGLEIKRELVEGTLAELKRAALPLLAALGGMLVPAAIYWALNRGGPGADGWGVPMATDIAFAVGVVTLLGKRVPAALRVLLLAFAIIDDLGAILVIAVFYSAGFSLVGLGVAALGVALLLVMQRIGVRPGMTYLTPVLVMWIGLHEAGVHPTIAGVVLGLMVPVRPWFGREGFLNVAAAALDDFQRRAAERTGDEELLEPLQRIAVAQREAVSPALRMQTALHGWVAFGVMPLFALANAGVNLGGIDLGAPGASSTALGVAGGLVLGKPVGVLLLSWLGVRLGLCVLPRGVSWGGMIAVGFAAGIGFTMAIFIAELGFEDQQLLAAAKVGILGATALAAAASLLAGFAFLPRRQPADVSAISASAVESSSELWAARRASR